jgi:cell division protease FtsH
MARRMVTQFGMSELGPVSYQEEEETLFIGREITRTHHHSNETIDRIDRAVQRISEECHGRAAKLLGENRDKLQKLAEALVQFETLSAEEVDIVLQDGDVEAYRTATATAAGAPRTERSDEKEKKPESLPGLDRGPAPGYASS